MLLHRFDTNISGNFRQFFSRFSAKFAEFNHFRKIIIEIWPDFDERFSELQEYAPTLSHNFKLLNSLIGDEPLQICENAWTSGSSDYILWPTRVRCDQATGLQGCYMTAEDMTMQALRTEVSELTLRLDCFPADQRPHAAGKNEVPVDLGGGGAST